MSFKKFVTFSSLAFIIGVIGFYVIALQVNFPKAPIPWVILTLLLFPASYCFQARLKLPESDEHTSLKSSELRRLRPIIRIKNKRLSFLMGYYLLSGIFFALGFFAIPSNSSLYVYFFSFSGGLILSSLYSLFFIKDVMDEIQSFKSLLIHRAESEKLRKEILDSAKKEAD